METPLLLLVCGEKKSIMEMYSNAHYNFFNNNYNFAHGAKPRRYNLVKECCISHLIVAEIVVI